MILRVESDAGHHLKRAPNNFPIGLFVLAPEASFRFGLAASLEALLRRSGYTG